LADYNAEQQADQSQTSSSRPGGDSSTDSATASEDASPQLHSGPIYEACRIEGDRIVITFQFAGSALQLEQPLGNAFMICGPDRKFVAANVQIAGTSLILYHPDITEPVAVRYGWQDTARPVLKNSEGLPASPFRTDDFPLLSDGVEF
jgi:sialate O-acetylesterase